MAMTILLCCSSVQALAIDNENNSSLSKTVLTLCDASFSSDERKQVQEDILAFKTYHILPDDFGKVIAVEKKITNLSSANIIYTIQYGDIVNEICVLDRSDNKVSYQIKQGNIQNFLTISGNELEVDGHRIVLPSDSKM